MLLKLPSLPPVPLLAPLLLSLLLLVLGHKLLPSPLLSLLLYLLP
uniref:Uncharacterized protein n=2 Tax=Picea TaxID=3328 RepID=A0A101M1T5_PICGL|nr:hypothetical protein ABT39_MTgene4037 [Picea glauca]QHR89735.1 hypothetical protein Q903MT_gene3757 [Picea sitchensis]